MIEVYALASGSAGNATYVRCGNSRFLFDAGISFKRIKEELKRLECKPEELDGLFLTHEHEDHIKGLGTLLKQTDIPVYGTKETWEALGDKVSGYGHRFIRLTKKVPFSSAEIYPFSIPHDAANPVGYTIYSQSKKITVVTDLGFVTDTVRQALDGSDILLLEANHDIDMLRYGPYPVSLRNRILGTKGHLSNEGAGWAVANMIRPDHLHLILAHRSSRNNHPDLQWLTVSTILQGRGLELGEDITMLQAQEKKCVGCTIEEE